MTTDDNGDDDDGDDDGRHERGHAKIAVPRAQEELTALYQRDRDGWLQGHHKFPPKYAIRNQTKLHLLSTFS